MRTLRFRVELKEPVAHITSKTDPASTVSGKIYSAPLHLCFRLYIQFYITRLVPCCTIIWRYHGNSHGEREASLVLPASVTGVGAEA